MTVGTLFRKGSNFTGNHVGVSGNGKMTKQRINGAITEMADEKASGFQDDGIFGKFADQEATRYAMDRIYEIDTFLTEENLPGKEYIESLDRLSPFREGINKRILQIGYSGDLSDIPERKKFLTGQYRKNGIKEPSDPTLRGWLSGAKMPAANSTGREDVFRLCFALEMTAGETAEFFLKAYLNRPFNYKKTKEAVYLYCLLLGKPYRDAVRIIQTVENMPHAVLDDREMETERLGMKIAGMKDENELIAFLTRHYYTEKEMHLTAFKTIEALLESCYDLAEKETAYTKEETRAVRTADALLDVIYDYDAYSMKAEGNITIQDSKFPRALKANWLDRQSFNNIKVHGKISDDVYRKALILLTFYRFFTSAYLAERKKRKESDIDLRKYADQFETLIEDSLYKCGYIQMYKRNPFDWLILYCAAFPNPVNQLRSVISYFFLDETDKSEDGKADFTGN